MMNQLTLEYVLEGHKRGYNFTSATHGFDADTLKHIWRSAMPRGQGWGNYIGAQSLKTFPLDDGRVAVSAITVTDMQDESGRTGIRRAVIDVLNEEDYLAHLDQRLLSYPAIVRERVEDLPTFMQRAKINNHLRFKSDPQVVLAYPYAGAYAWQLIEALLIKLALSPSGPLRRWGPVIPITTLALDYREESPVVVLPQEQAQKLTQRDKKLNVIDL